MISSAKSAGVASPHLFFVDPSAATLVMEYLGAGRLKDAIDGLPGDAASRIFITFGQEIAKLHLAGIMHGDLTTANVIRRGGDLVFIDFGLSVRSTRLEDHAVDLRLIKETLYGGHPALAASAMESLARGYAKQAGGSRTGQVLRQLASIERRGRYARVV